VGDYRVVFRASAEKELLSLSLLVKSRIENAIDKLASHPRPSGVRKLKGATNTYRIRVGEYRVVFEIEDEALRIIVTKIRHRSQAYRQN